MGNSSPLSFAAGARTSQFGAKLRARTSQTDPFLLTCLAHTNRIGLTSRPRSLAEVSTVLSVSSWSFLFFSPLFSLHFSLVNCLLCFVPLFFLFIFFGRLLFIFCSPLFLSFVFSASASLFGLSDVRGASLRRGQGQRRAGVALRHPEACLACHRIPRCGTRAIASGRLGVCLLVGVKGAKRTPPLLGAPSSLRQTSWPNAKKHDAKRGLARTLFSELVWARGGRIQESMVHL